jgi:hypothetical protein
MCDCFPCELFDDEFELLRTHPKVREILGPVNTPLEIEGYSQVYDALKEIPLKEELVNPSMRWEWTRKFWESIKK